MGIETGLLIETLRGRRAGPLAHRVADVAARHYDTLTTGVRLGLGAADLVRGIVGTGAPKTTLDGLCKAFGGRLPKWSPALVRRPYQSIFYLLERCSSGQQPTATPHAKSKNT